MEYGRRTGLQEEVIFHLGEELGRGDYDRVATWNALVMVFCGRVYRVW